MIAVRGFACLSLLLAAAAVLNRDNNTAYLVCVFAGLTVLSSFLIRREP